MADCEELRAYLWAAKGARNAARSDNARAENEGQPPPYSENEVLELVYRVHEAAKAAREAGCDIDDIVDKDVGEGDWPPP